MANYLLYMEDAGMMAQLRHQTEGIRLLGKVDKVYVDNTNLIHVLAKENKNTGNIRETFFINQLRIKHSLTSSSIADFSIEDIDFEIGGKQKRMKQINQASKGFSNLGGGYIIIGVKAVEGIPERPVLGIPDSKIDAIQQQMIGFNNLIRPVYHARMVLEEVDGKKIMVLWVPGGSNRPYEVPEDITAKKKISFLS